MSWLGLLLALYLAFYAKYYFFGGGVAWGDRYVLLPVQLLGLFTVPLLLASPRPLPGWGRRALWAVVLFSTILQAASTVIAPNLETMQRDLGYTHGAIWNRAVNLAEIARDREEPARFAGIPIEWRTLYYPLPASVPVSIAGSMGDCRLAGAAGLDAAADSRNIASSEHSHRRFAGSRSRALPASLTQEAHHPPLGR